MSLLPLRLSPQLITVDREHFWLSLWRLRGGRYERVKRWEITVGAVGHKTPAGLYFAHSKTRKPDWLAPDEDWVPVEDRGKVFKFDDPKNPFAGGFISIANTKGVGIHGTKFDPNLGTRSSHGCIRMAVPDFLELFKALRTGAPVFIY